MDVAGFLSLFLFAFFLTTTHPPHQDDIVNAIKQDVQQTNGEQIRRKLSLKMVRSRCPDKSRRACNTSPKNFNTKPSRLQMHHPKSDPVL